VVAHSLQPGQADAPRARRLSQATLEVSRRLVYRPHERPEFYLADTGAPVWIAPAVVFTDAAVI
jgi:hypothetical protein